MTPQIPTPNKTHQTSRRKPRKFSGQAKTVVSAAAVTALIGGWNVIAHLDNGQGVANAFTQPAPQIETSAVTNEVRLHTPTATPWPTLAPLVVDAIPTLAARNALPGSTDAFTPRSGAIQLPEMAALAPLPELAPLPAMPSLPPPPSNNSAGAQTSGGS